jgi:hypothetical protein
VRILIAVLLLAGFSPAQTVDHLRWVDLHKEKNIVEAVESALKDETYTHLREIGIYEEAALVITAYREESGSSYVPFEWDTLTAFTCSVTQRRCEKLWLGYKLEVVADGRFVKGQRVADVVFKYMRCVECEPSWHVTSFFYDQSVGGWQIRKWGSKDVPGGSVGYADIDWSAASTYGVKDFDGDGADDIGIWLREVGEGRVQMSYRILTVKAGQERIVTLTKPAEVLRFKKAVCDLAIESADFGKSCAALRRSHAKK